MMKIDRKLKQTTCLTTILKVQVQRDNVSEMFGWCCQRLSESLQAPRNHHKEQIVQELQELHSNEHCMRWRQCLLITQILSFVTNKSYGMYSWADVKSDSETRLISRRTRRRRDAVWCVTLLRTHAQRDIGAFAGFYDFPPIFCCVRTITNHRRALICHSKSGNLTQIYRGRKDTPEKSSFATSNLAQDLCKAYGRWVGCCVTRAAAAAQQHGTAREQQSKDRIQCTRE